MRSTNDTPALQPTAESRRLHAMSKRRSRLVENPLLALNCNSREGRQLYDLAVRYLGQSSADTSNPLAVQDAIAAAQLTLRADALRGDLNSSPVDLARVEYCLRIRLRKLGIRDPKPKRSLPSAPSAGDMIERMRGATP
jgi:hypothetical protein